MKLVNTICNHMVRQNIIPEEDIEIYEYGLNMAITILINVFISIVIGIFMGMVWQSVVFLLVYSLLRTYAGGYHARTQFRCNVISVITLVLVLYTMRIFSDNYMVSICGLIFSLITVFVLSPVADMNKPLDDNEVVLYRKKSLQIVALESLVSIVLLAMGKVAVASAISISITMVAIMLIVGWINNKYVLKVS